MSEEPKILKSLQMSTSCSERCGPFHTVFVSGIEIATGSLLLGVPLGSQECNDEAFLILPS